MTFSFAKLTDAHISCKICYYFLSYFLLLREENRLLNRKKNGQELSFPTKIEGIMENNNEIYDNATQHNVYYKGAECNNNINYQHQELNSNSFSFPEILSVIDGGYRRTNVIYIKLCGTHESAALLSQILYWFGRGSDGSRRAKFSYNNKPCLIKRRDDWEEECCLTPKQYDAAIKILKNKGYITTEVHRSKIYGNERATHIFLNESNLHVDVLKYMQKESKFRKVVENFEIPKSGNSKVVNNFEIPKMGNSIEIPKMGNCTYTDITTENSLTSKEDLGLVRFFYALIKKLNPAIPDKSEAQLSKWVKELADWRRIEKRSIEDIKKVIEFIELDHNNSKSDFRWSHNVQSILKLRKHYPTMFARMMTPSKEKEKYTIENRKIDIIKENQQIAKAIANRVKHSERSNFTIDEFSVRITTPDGKYFPLGFSEHGFRDQVESVLRKSRML